MSRICIKKDDYQALFEVDRGMNFTSFKRGEIEVIDQSTQPLFDERSAGLGAMIGPHFHHRKGVEKELYSHGIGRYVPWEIEESSSEHIVATLRGDMLYKGEPLALIEGFDFSMRYAVRCESRGMKITLSFEAEKPAVMGLHTYYRAAKNSLVRAKIEERYNVGGTFQPLPPTLGRDLVYPIEDECDYGFLSHPGRVELETKSHFVRLQYEGEECSWQLWHPKEASFVCVEPIAATNPRELKNRKGSIDIFLAIEPKS